MSNCATNPPCDTEFPLFCEGLEITTDGRKLVVEDNASCQKALQEPTEVSILQYDQNNDVAWKSGSLISPIKLPSLQLNAINVAPKIMVLQVDGTVRQWQPTDIGDNFLAYWDGTQWKIGNLATFFPSGDGVIVKNGSSFYVASGVDGEFLQVIDGGIQFNSSVPGGTPTGTVTAFAGTVSPSGWVLCNGGLYGRTSGDPSPQPTLFDVIGTTYGVGDSLTTFAVPDLRGMFLRGFDNGRNLDPLRAFGTNQVDAFKSHNHSGNTGLFNATHTHSFNGTTSVDSPDHTHQISEGSNVPQAGGQLTSGDDFTNIISYNSTSSTASTRHTHTYSGTTSSGGTNHQHTISSQGDTETRPRNVAMNYIIKT